MKDIKSIVEDLKTIPQAVHKYLFLNTKAISEDTGKPEGFVDGALYISDVTIPRFPENIEAFILPEKELNVNGARPSKEIKHPKHITDAIKRFSRYISIVEFLYKNENIHNAGKVADELGLPATSVYHILPELMEEGIELIERHLSPKDNGHYWHIVRSDVAEYLIKTKSEMQDEFAKVAHQISPKNFLKDRIEQMYSEKSFNRE